MHTLEVTCNTVGRYFAKIGSRDFGGNYFDGILSDFQVERASTLIRDYPIDETWVSDLILIDNGTDGSNGLAVNIVPAQSESFTQQAARNYTELDAALSMYYTIPTATMTGDFEVELKAAFTGNSNSQALIGIADSSLDIVRLDNLSTSPVITVRFNGSQQNINLSAVSAGIFNTYRIKKVGTTISAYLNDVLQGSASNGLWSAPATLERIGNVNTAEYFSGVLADVKIWNESATLIRDYPIDETWVSDLILIDNGTDGSNGTAVSITTANVSNMASWQAADGSAILIEEQA
jgi:hypothetical protein